MSARARKSATKLPTADMSPGAAEARILKYQQAHFDPGEIHQKSLISFVGLNFDMFTGFCGFPLAAKKEPTIE